MNKITFFVFVILLIVYIYNCRGINMKCPICFNNGHHLHVGQFAIKTNHGPKKNDKFEHSPCKICMKNPGALHFHLCMPWNYIIDNI